MEKIITDIYLNKKGGESIKYKCIWDTGSVETLVSDSVINDLKPDTYGYVMLNTIHGEKRSDKYLLILTLIGHSKSISTNPACFGKGREFDVIIGMDIITHGRFLLEGGDFSFTIKSLQ